MADAYELEYLPGFIEDLQDLAAAAQEDPGGSAEKTLRVTLAALHDLRTGHERGTHRLGYMSSYPDLSDCETTYIGIDPSKRPDHRLVWRELPPRSAGDLPRRQVIALGDRAGGDAYDVAGQRLARPVGVRLAELPSPAQRAAADRSTLNQVRDTARERQRQAIDDDQSRVIGKGETQQLE